MKIKHNKKILTLILIVTIIVLTLWFTGVIGLWTYGMTYIANNTEKFTDRESHVIQGEYSVSIDLNNLESNIGKELYNDSENKICVSWIDNTGSINTGGYRIGFRSYGQYSLTSATLTSGINHEYFGENISSSSDMPAKMISKYNNKIYSTSVFGATGINQKDGDSFAFYIFSNEAYEKREILLNEKGIVDLTVTNLYKNIWTEKIDN